VACIAFAYVVYRLVIYDVAVKEIIIRALDLISTAVPAALPVAMTVQPAQTNFTQL
jgi:magnesium-transporting ATPase (P-type)